MQSGSCSRNKTKYVSGNVTSADDNMGSSGLLFRYSGTKQARQTDFDFDCIKLKLKPVMYSVISFMGYKTQKITVGTQRKINVAMRCLSPEPGGNRSYRLRYPKEKVNTAATSLVSGKIFSRLRALML